MDSEQRAEAIFGLFDGTVSIIGFVFALMLHGSPPAVIAIGGLGGAISATVSMGTGEFEKDDGPTAQRIRLGLTMGLATLVGSLLPVLPFFFLAKMGALVLGGVLACLVALWIGYEKRQGVKGYVNAYIALLGAAGLTLALVALIPSSAV